jgi:LysM repeat protein
MVAKSARFLAPIALAAVAVGTYLIVHTSLAKHSPAIVRTTTDGARRGRTHGGRAAPTPIFYVVRPNDTLSSISVSTHVPIQRLESLNASVSPNSLQTGQRLRLRR